MKLIWRCLFAPRLYKVYFDGPPDKMYQPQSLEKWGDKMISWTHTIINIGLYASPLIALYIFKRGLFTYEETKTIVRFFGGIGCLLTASFLLRAYGRACNPIYVKFLQILANNQTDKNSYLTSIRKYDFEFTAWPVSYKVPATAKSNLTWFSQHPFSTCANADLPLYQRASIQILAYVATHTFGLRLIYPGSLAIVQNFVWTPLFQGRAQLVEAYEGQRAKIQTTEGNTIDTMFVDNRALWNKGSTLVICCEGNSGFYEIGIMTTSIKAGYSTLGWNHPGFAGSTGLPYPDQEQNAIDAVMQYAISELGFQPDHIVLFGWSIGGYTASWAAANYPVKALILDASFDDLLPLAENQMPASWSLLVKEVIRSHVNLNVGELVRKYEGPVQLIRRTEDEIICLRQGRLGTNCGNSLLIKLIEKRHPGIVRDAQKLKKFVALSEMQREQLSKTLAELGDEEKHILKFISKYMRDYSSTHCTPLSEDLFQVILENV